MRRMRVLATAGTVAVVVGVISFTLGRTLSVQEPVATGMPVKIAEPELVTGTIPSRPLPVQAQPEAPSTPPVVSPAAFSAPDRANVAAASSPACGNPDALGISRVVEIDTAGGPGFGFEQFKAYDFLSEHEVVLTFDDGPWPGNTPAVLKALADQCTKALFFPIGKHAMWHPEILKQVAAAGHTIGSHTWSHADLSKLTIGQAKEEIEKGASAVRAALGEPGASFFRFPALRDPPEMVTYLGTRNIGIFSTDLDSFDFKIRKPEQVVVSVMTNLKKRGKGIVLLHDFQHPTSLALPELLAQLKAGGYKIVQVKAKELVQTLPEYDEAIMKEFGGNTVSTRPTSSVVRTVSE
jgi:peptidoglycan/xylan/chitin deacetylase (PgdA/CDA1 family)